MCHCVCGTSSLVQTGSLCSVLVSGMDMPKQEHFKLLFGRMRESDL